MQQQQSEKALALLETSEGVIASVETHDADVARQLGERLTPPDTSPALDGEPARSDAEPSVFQTYLNVLKQALVASMNLLAEADHSHVLQLALIQRLRHQRDALAANLYKQFTAVRHAVESLFGPGSAFRWAGIEGPTAQKPRKLLRQIELAISQLLDPDLELPTAEFDGMELNAQALARGLQAGFDRLRKILADLRGAERFSQETRKVKNRAIDEHQQLLLWIARILEGNYVLAGEHELAERLRPTTRRSGRPVESEESPSEESVAEESPAEESPAEESPAEESPAEESDTSETIVESSDSNAVVTTASAS